MTPAMRDLLAHHAANHGRDVSEADLIRAAIQQYLDQRADAVGSRRHFQRSLQDRVDRLEHTLTFHLHVLIALIAMLLGDESEEAIDEAIVAAKRDGSRLLARIEAVRDLKADG
jgi:Arc/MetJ-type ribon-helix-helix transcriptional regulator